MNWMQIIVTTRHTATEAVAEIFTDLGSGGVEIEDPRTINDYLSSAIWDYTDIEMQPDLGTDVVKAYFPCDEHLKGKLEYLDAALDGVKKTIDNAIPQEIIYSQINEEDWSSCWKKYFHPIRVGEKIIIKPTWEEYQEKKGDIIVHLDPGMAFGTGTHDTTCLCIEQLEKVITPKSTVFDVGSGSGILSIVAAKLGADKITAIDIDNLAVKIAKENALLNGLSDKIKVWQGDLLSVVDDKANVIVANIIASIIGELVFDIPKKLSDDGVFIASGIISERADEVVEKARKAGLRLCDKVQKNGWVMLVMRKEIDNE